MSMVKLNEQIVSLDKLSRKSSDHSFTFKEICSLIFYAILNLSKKETECEPNCWTIYYREFLNDLEKQNNIGWPQFTIRKNDYGKRIDLVLTDPYEKSNNLLTLLLRLLYVENYKRQYIFEYMDYYKILGWKLETNIQDIENLSLDRIFNLLKKCINHYNKVYNNDKSFEYQLAKAILRQID